MTKIIVLIFHLVLFPSLYLSQSLTPSLLFDASHYATQGAALFSSYLYIESSIWQVHPCPCPEFKPE